jgi:hypothetical protein
VPIREHVLIDFVCPLLKAWPLFDLVRGGDFNPHNIDTGSTHFVQAVLADYVGVRVGRFGPKLTVFGQYKTSKSAHIIFSFGLLPENLDTTKGEDIGAVLRSESWMLLDYPTAIFDRLRSITFEPR